MRAVQSLLKKGVQLEATDHQYFPLHQAISAVGLAESTFRYVEIKDFFRNQQKLQLAYGFASLFLFFLTQ